LVVGNATYGTSRPDVCSALPGRPGCPNVGYTFALNTAGWSAGPHVITVSTTDSDGTGEVGLASVTVTTAANATAPTVWIDQPAAGVTVSGAVTISGWALDNASAVGSAISNVQVLVDGLPVGNATYGTNRADVCSALPGRPGCPNVGYTFTLNSGTLTLGSHTITVKAIDSDATPDAGAASATVTINTAPATVWIDQPLPGAVSGTVTISGWAINSASGVGTAISGVQLLVDGAVVGGATYGTSRPDVCGVLPGRPNCPNVGYTFALNTGNLSPGQHVITVTAVDSDKVPQSGSASVTVTVNNGPPTVWIDQPVAGATISGTVTVSGWAVDNGTVVGTAINSVQVKVDGTVIGTAAYGSSRPDVCAVYVGRPGCPNVGYSFPWNTSGLSAGVHILTVTATDANGNADIGNASVVVTK
jgi:Bacterial Ig domain